MRKKKYEITDTELLHEFLQTSTVGRFGCNGSDGYPYVIPVNYVYHRGAIYFHTGRQGQKIDNINRDPRASFVVDQPLSYLDTSFDGDAPPCHVTQYYRSVIIKGKAAVVDNGQEKLEALNALMATHEGVPGYREIEKEMKGVDICTVIKISVETITGKFNLAQSKSAEEKEQIVKFLRLRNRVGDMETADLIK